MSKEKIPTCFGTGLIALDMVVNGDRSESPRFWAGGSCGNVLTILAYLGWHSYPVARFGNDKAAKAIVNDMRRHKVKMQFIFYDKSIETTIILQRIFMTPDGIPTHRFYWVCPSCGNWFPRYKPVLLREVQRLSEDALKMTCFYFDRVSAASLFLAEKARDQGALVVFEPTSIKEDKQFKIAMSVCDILKYSNERTKNYDKFIYESPVQLVVETLGAEGLRYRLRRNNICGKWKLLPAFPVAKLKDAAGAGDWCTAGMVDMLSRETEVPLRHIPEKMIFAAIQYGQALSALNCSFEGARGAMYGLNKKQFDDEIQKILELKGLGSSIEDNLSTKVKKTAQCICPTCQTLANRSKAKKR